jgi:hypothetical protein
MKGYIYVIKCKDENIKDCYVGSTTNIVSRKKQHKYSCCNPNIKKYNYKVYKFIRDNGGFDNFVIDIIKEVEVENKKELAQLELEQYTLLQPSLNSNLPLIDIDMKKEYSKEYHKEYYNKNREIIKDYSNKYYNKNKEHFKQRYEDKKDEYKARNNNRYQLMKQLLENHKNNIE